MWIIEYDHLEKKKVQIKSRGFKEGVPLPHPFRLLDDDREVYFEGHSDDCETEEGAFAPLDDFGEPDSGCTIIQYKDKNGEWADL
jgi:hypothetical protein